MWEPVTAIDHINRAVAELTARFRRARDRREAHRLSRPILEDLAADERLIEAILARHLAQAASLAVPHYPGLSFHIARNRDIHLLANACMAHPEGHTHLTLKPIHDHRSLLLTTVTIHGPGYEHWLFSRPTPVDRGGARYRTRLLSRGPHRLGRPAFVDTTMAHTLTFPPALSLTLCLWTQEERQPTVAERALRRLRLAGAEAVRRLPGSAPTLRPPRESPADFYPGGRELLGLKHRHAFPFGPAADYCQSLVHVLQETHCEDLAAMMRARLRDLGPADRRAAERALDRLARGEAVEGRYSAGHTTDPTAIFTTADMLAAARG